MAVLDDPTARERLLQLLEAGEKQPAAALAIGCSGKTVTRYAAAHPEFAAQLTQSRMRAKQVARYGPCVAPREDPAQPDRAEAESAPVDREADARRLERASRGVEAWIDHLHETVADPDHPGLREAMRQLGAWYLDAPITARRRQAEAAVGDIDGGVVMVIELPEAEAPQVIDAEIVDQP